jgi:hypothetical protein
VSPILLVIYISKLFRQVEEREENGMAPSLVNDIAWVAERKNLTQGVQKLQKGARFATEWAEVNSVEFDISKSEAILFSKK